MTVSKEIKEAGRRIKERKKRLYIGIMEQFTTEKEQRTNILPVIPLRGKVAFPQVAILFEVGRERTLHAIKRAVQTDSLVFILT